MDAKREADAVLLRLSHHEAGVLDGLLHRWERDGLDEPRHFEDQAEQCVLWKLSASLEPVLAREAFSADDDSILNRARSAVRDVEAG